MTAQHNLQPDNSVQAPDLSKRFLLIDKQDKLFIKDLYNPYAVGELIEFDDPDTRDLYAEQFTYAPDYDWDGRYFVIVPVNGWQGMFYRHNIPDPVQFSIIAAMMGYIVEYHLEPNQIKKSA